MAVIQIKNLTFSYYGRQGDIFRDVSLMLDTTWKLGIIGRNGRGKTTFLKLLLREYEYQGEITAPVRFDYFPFEVKNPDRPFMDIAEEIAPGFEEWRLFLELSLLEVREEAVYRRFSTLSNGERTKLLLAALFLKEGGFPLIDEPTNHLDMKGREALSRYLNVKQGFIIVSHDRAFLDGCIDRVLSINKTDIELRRGNFSSWWENKLLRDRYELDENRRLEKDIDRLSEAAKRTESWAEKLERSKIGAHAADRGYIGHKSAKMMKRAIVTRTRAENAAEEKSKLLNNIETLDELSLSPLRHHSARLIEAKNLSISYGDRKVCQNISFSVYNRDRLAIIGGNGAGKSSVLKLLTGETRQNISYEGELSTASGIIISYAQQETDALRGSLKAFPKERGIDETLFFTILRKLDFSRELFDRDIGSYSDGQKKKVLLAKSLSERAHVYIWDEPLNFIDVFSRIQLEKLILEFEPSMIFVEHDKGFVESAATRRLYL